MSTAIAAHAAIRLHPNDDVIIATRQLVSGTRIETEDLVVTGLIPPGHKIATRAIAKGEPVKRYNQIIGVAREAIARGQHVHTHNLSMAEFAREHEFGVDTHPTAAAREPAHFMGIRRADGRVATRNYIGILTSVNCSATVARAIADHFRRDVHPQELAAFPNVDGVIVPTWSALAKSVSCLLQEGAGRLQQTKAGQGLFYDAILFLPIDTDVRPQAGDDNNDRIIMTDPDRLSGSTFMVQLVVDESGMQDHLVAYLNRVPSP